MRDHEETQPALVVPPEYFGSQSFAASLVCSPGTIAIDTTAIYRKQSFQNRCRIRTPDGLLWLSVPVRRTGHRLAVCDLAIDNDAQWSKKHWRSLEFNYRSCPYFEFYEPAIAPLYRRHWESLASFTVATVLVVAEALDVTVTVLSGQQNDPSQNAGASREGFRKQGSYVEPPYQQNFGQHLAGTSVIDMLFNIGPTTRDVLSKAFTKVT